MSDDWNCRYLFIWFAYKYKQKIAALSYKKGFTKIEFKNSLDQHLKFVTRKCRKR